MFFVAGNKFLSIPIFFFFVLPVYLFRRSTGGEIFHGTSAKLANDRDSDYIVPTELPVDFNSEIFVEHRDGIPISVNGPKTNFEEIDPFYGNDLSMTVVYYLDGCLPSR